MRPGDNDQQATAMGFCWIDRDPGPAEEEMSSPRAMARGSRLLVPLLDDIVHAISSNSTQTSKKQIQGAQGRNRGRDTTMAQDSLILLAKHLIRTLSWSQTVFAEEGSPLLTDPHFSGRERINLASTTV